MTAAIVTPFGTPYDADTVEAGCERALTHLARAIHHTTPGQLWERIAESEATA